MGVDDPNLMFVVTSMFPLRSTDVPAASFTDVDEERHFPDYKSARSTCCCCWR